ncbi:NIPSNAP family containing protein [Sodalis praecaptivus]|uniref:NIPSNAP family containing protein n=1 Tax=Sodalis praecaptivus TaxID=1239307 RepID=W0HWW4_9GAMM|nr:NIPSNAP family protein [Sodalis praecaptivus]AHF76643.1 NIPSNAP family containing protein [Sodalis praecaptivus]
MLLELTRLSVAPLALAEVASELRDWARQPAAGGEPLGFWRSEMGELFQLLMLRAFPSEQALLDARQRARLDPAPLGIRSSSVRLSMESYMPFPFLPLPQSQLAKPAQVYEFRTYWLKPGGLGPTLAGWEKAVPRARDYTAHLITNMYALDGPPRITHIWGFSSLEERARLRAEHYAAGLWPPEGGPQQIDTATSLICLAQT